MDTQSDIGLTFAWLWSAAVRPAPALQTMLLALACAIAMVLPASAGATDVLSVSLETPGPSGAPASLRVEAMSADRPVNGMVVREDGQEVFGLAACRTELPAGTPTPPFAPGSPVRMVAPSGAPPAAGTPAVIRVDAGGCEEISSSIDQPLTLVAPPEGQSLVPLLLGPPLPLGTPLPVGELPLPAVSAARKGQGRRKGKARKVRCPHSGRRPGRSIRKRRQAKQAVLCLLNRERRRYGLRSLRTNPRLGRAAYFHSTKMVTRSFFGHVQPGGVGLADRLFANRYLHRGLRRYRAGENIGFGRAGYATPRSMFRAWINSSGHRANILDPLYREIGIGLVPGTPTRYRGITFTTDFGMRRRR